MYEQKGLLNQLGNVVRSFFLAAFGRPDKTILILAHHNVGSDNLGFFSLIGTLVAAGVYANFMPGNHFLFQGFLAAYIVSYFIRWYESWRRERARVILHPESIGIPFALPLWERFSEAAHARFAWLEWWADWDALTYVRFVQPTAVILSGLVIRLIDPTLGWWLVIGGIFLAARVSELYRTAKRQALMGIGAEQEGEILQATRNRLMGGSAANLRPFGRDIHVTRVPRQASLFDSDAR